MIQIRDTLVHRLDYLFSPPGLPLVPKEPGAVPTTSIVVRGGPGTGKTTLAMALALTVARQNRGRVLYLSTEVAPADAVRKAELLGLPDTTVGAWSTARESDELLVDHLGAPMPTPEMESPEGRLTASMDRVWQRLHEVAPPGPPLRAVVIDAFALVGLDASKETRAEVMNLLVVLEARGICPILVEEAPAPEHDWIGYLVDLQFETGWGLDPDTHTRFRQLSCSKSRYVEARPGPHDYGREEGRLAVWPELAPIAGRDHLEPIQAKPVLIDGWADELEVLEPGDLYGDVWQDGFLWNHLGATPWLETVEVYPTSMDGPHAKAWSLHAKLRAGSGVGRVMHPETAAARTRYSIGFADDLQALAALGAVFVVDVDSAGQMKALPFTVTPGVRELTETVKAGDWQSLTRLKPVLEGDVLDWWGGPHGEATKKVCSRLRKKGAAAEHHLVYAALSALHLESKPALDWLVEQFEGSRRDVARALAIAPLVAQGRPDEARAALAALPELDDEDRERLLAEIARRSA